MRRRLLAFIAGAVLLPAVAAGSAAADDPLVQGAGQSAGSQQTAGSSATSTQSHPRTRTSRFESGVKGTAAWWRRRTDRRRHRWPATPTARTSRPPSRAERRAWRWRTSQRRTARRPSRRPTRRKIIRPNTNISVRIMSPGDDGSVTQTNDSSAKSAAGNKNSTTQSAGQSGGGVQTAKQDAANKQSANSSASSTQDHPSNVNIPVRIYSDGDNGSVEQVNDSSAKSAAGNKNETTQNAGQGSGSMSAPVRDRLRRRVWRPRRSERSGRRAVRLQRSVGAVVGLVGAGPPEQRQHPGAHRLVG